MRSGVLTSVLRKIIGHAFLLPYFTFSLVFFFLSFLPSFSSPHEGMKSRDKVRNTKRERERDKGSREREGENIALRFGKRCYCSFRFVARIAPSTRTTERKRERRRDIER